MAVNVGDMSWKEMQQLVNGRFNRLAMCKRGTLETEINKKKEALGKKPEFTKEEKEDIDKALASKIQKAMTPTIKMVKKYEYSPTELSYQLRIKAEKVTADKYVHPALKKWKEDIHAIDEEHKAREAELDTAFQDAIDSFALKLWDISEFPTKLEELEMKSW